MAPNKKATKPKKSQANKIAKAEKKSAQAAGDQTVLDRPALGSVYPWDERIQGFNFGSDDGPNRTGVNGKIQCLYYLVYLLSLRMTRPDLQLQ
jgi:hypothetical protein